MRWNPVKINHFRKVVLLLSTTFILNSCSTQKEDKPVVTTEPIQLKPLTNTSVNKTSPHKSYNHSGPVLRSGPSAPGARIVVTVNNEPITESDIDARINFLVISGMVQKTPEGLDNLRKQILSSLIDEKIQTHAVKPKDPTMINQMVKDAFANMAKENNMTPDQLKEFFKKNNIPEDTVLSRLRAQIGWVEYIRAFYGSYAHISDPEVDAVLAKYQARQDKTMYEAAEIVFIVNNPTEKTQARQEADFIYKQLKAGADFKTMAQQFSRSASKLKGGDIGQLVKGQMDPAVERTLDQLQVGQFSEPIETATGYTILLLKNKKNEGLVSTGEKVVSLRQVTIPMSTAPTPEQQEKIIPELNSYQATRGCDQFEQTVQKFGRRIEKIDGLPLTQVSDNGKKQILAATPGTVMQPALSEEGLKITMFCSLEDKKFKMPERKEIREILEQEKLSQRSNRELLKHKAAAYIKYH